MKYFRKIVLLALFVSVVTYFGCRDNWDEHTEFKQYYSDITLLDKLIQEPSLSKFVQYLKVTGYDELLASGQSFTVWAPQNSEFANIDEIYTIADTVTTIADTLKMKKLKLFVSNHIINESINSSKLKQLQKVKALSGKNLILSDDKSRIEESEVVNSDQYCKNGILHIISKPLVPKMTIWEFLMTSSDASTFRNYIKQYDGKLFDRSNSRPISVENGFVIYDSVFVESNSFMLSYGRLDAEDSLYTFILLTDEALQAEKDRLITYFTSTTPFKTDSILTWNIYKDFVFDGKYELNTIPNVLRSTDSVNVTFDKGAVISKYSASNGIVYIMNRCSIPLKDKLRPILIDPDLYAWSVSANNTAFYERFGTTISGTMSGYVKRRARQYALNKYDFLFTGYGGSKGVVMFPTPIYSNVRCKFYWTAVNDFQAAPIAQSMSLIGNAPTFIPPDSIRYTPTPAAEDFNNEIYLGEGTTNLYEKYSIKVYSGYNSASSTTPIVLNYIKIVPVVE